MNGKKTSSATTAFTLIELLVVIAIIALLAALVTGLAGAATAKGKLNRSMGQLAKLETWIDSYKEKQGYYPPDNQVATSDPRKWSTNQLFYELSGSTLSGNEFTTLVGSYRIRAADVKAYFGVGDSKTGLGGFANSSRAGGSDDSPTARKYMNEFKEDELRNVGPNTNAPVWVFSLPTKGHNDFTDANGKAANLWNYISSNPTNNPSSFDLWIDIVIRGKTNRISNWSKAPIKL